MSLTTFFLNFSDYSIGLFSLADFALIILVFSALQSMLNIQFIKKTSVSVSLILIGSTGGFFLNGFKDYFSIAEYLASFVKLIFYMMAVLLIPDYLIARRVDVIKILRIFMYTAVTGAVIQLIIIRLFGVESWPIYSLGSNWFGLNSPDTMFVNNGMIRARSLYSEPAAFTVGITLVFLLLLYKGSEQFLWKDNLFYVIGITSSQLGLSYSYT